MKSLLLLLSVFTFTFKNLWAQVEPPCSSKIYCTGSLLKDVQLQKLFPDSKTFVDMSIKNGFTPDMVLENFKNLGSVSKTKLHEFVENHFENGNEFEPWVPEDWSESPKSFKNIQDKKLFSWANDLNLFWEKLGRKIKSEVKEDPERFSIVYVSDGIIVPGGRFREFYYWDSYWIQIGLLHSEMNKTVRGMIDNFIEMVENDDYGFVPNGGRVYYRRSQPPLLIPMVKNYINYINPSSSEAEDYLKEILPSLNKEFMFWINNRMVSVMDSNNNNIHRLAIYNSTKNEPRPESYREDYNLAEKLAEREKTLLYTDLHSGAESGWDFSSRWWSVPENVTGSLVHTRTTNVIPADLNGFLYHNAILMSEFYEQIGDRDSAEVYKDHGKDFQEAIMGILWDEEQGSWFDYDLEKGELRKDFYMSNIIPLWAGVDKNVADQVVKYLRGSGALEYPGGVPTSLKQTGEQWDFPNGWAPLEHLMVDALAKSNNKEAEILAYEIAEKWTLGNYKYYAKKKIMLEKYDVTSPGYAGGGGEYEVVIGFGWTNGVILDFLVRYGNRLKVSDSVNGALLSLTPLTSTAIVVGIISIILCTIWGTNHIRKKYSRLNRTWLPNNPGVTKTELPFCYNLTNKDSNKTRDGSCNRSSNSNINNLLGDDKQVIPLLQEICS